MLSHAIMLSLLIGAAAEMPPLPKYPDVLNITYYLSGAGQAIPIRTTNEYLRRRAHVMQGFLDVIGPMPGPERRVPLDVEILEEADMGEYVRRHITVAVEPGDRLPAYLCVPKERAAPAPAVLCLHPTGVDGKDIVVGLSAKENRHYGDELARRGYVTLAPDYPNMGEYKVDAYAMGYASTTAKAIWNHMRCVDYLQSLEEVDPERIGSIGHSLGGHNSLFLGFMDPRVKVMVTSCGFNRFARYYGGDLTGWSHAGYMPRIAEIYRKNPVFMPWDFPDLLAGLAPRRVFISAPINDANFDVAGVREAVQAAQPIFELYRVPDNLIAVYPNCDHDFPKEVRERAYTFLKSALGM